MPASNRFRDALAESRRRGAQTIERWRRAPASAALAEHFAGLPADDPVAATRRAESLLRGADWAAELLAPLIEALREDPLFEPPFKVSRDRFRTGAVLFDHPAVSISACLSRAEALRTAPPAATVLFSGRLSVTRYVEAGGARLRRWITDPVPPDAGDTMLPTCREMPDVCLRDGEVRTLDGRSEAQLVVSPATDMMTLVATIRAGVAPLMREHRIVDGAAVRLASADDRASRAEMLLAFLGRAGRSDAGDRFEAATRDPAFHLRWAAMREWLALDARAALPRLEAMARDDPHGQVRAAAAATIGRVRARIDQAARCPG